MDVDAPLPDAPAEQRDAKEKVMHHGKRVSYFYDGDVGNFQFSPSHPMKPHRMRVTHTLLTAYGMLDKMDVLRPKRATSSQLTRFHTDDYVDFLEAVTPETVNQLTGHGSRYLVGDDCPSFEGLFEFCSISAGGSIAAAERLNHGAADIAINWAGGLHHAKKREASGFCYVNDIVLGILELLRVHPRVLYIDIDVHHGDGVEEAFYTTDRVLTASFHQFDQQFFPGTGDVRDVGYGKGKNYSVNVPLREGIDDESYKSIFEPVIQHIMDWYQPGAVVLQCGADSLSGDKLGSLNLSMKGHAACVKFVESFGLPTLLLGGGGYTVKNVARTWAYETGIVLGEELDENLPYNDYLEYFGPKFFCQVEDSNQTNQNSPQYLEDIKTRVIDQLRTMPFAPSVGMHEVPMMSVGEAIRVSDEEDGSEDEDDVDVRISYRLKEIHQAAAKSQARQRARAAAAAIASSSHSHRHDDDEDSHDEDDDDGHLSANRPIDFFSSTSRFRRSFASRPPIPTGATGNNGTNSVSFATMSDQIDAVMADKSRTRNGGARPYYAGGGNGNGKDSSGRSRQTSVKRSFFATGSQSPLIAGGCYSYQSPFSVYTTATYLDASSGSSSTSTKEEEPEEDAPPAAALLEEDEDAPALPDKGKGKAKARERWVMGIDEAGRGPVLGPMVYGASFCPLSFLPTLSTLGFDDSKALSHATRNHLFSLFDNPPRSSPGELEGEAGEGGWDELHYATRVLSPADISRDMLRGVGGVNLNRQAEEATIGLISEVRARGVDLAECYVDALGACGPWQAKLSALFPTIAFTVCPKADSLFKIVGAASIAAKITRDRWIENWIHPEPIPIVHLPFVEDAAASKKRKADVVAKGKKKGRVGKKLLKVGEEEEEDAEAEGEGEGEDEEAEEEEVALGKNGLGSGYPSDPTTKTFLRDSLHPLFGYPSIVRFSWSTVKVLLDKEAQGVRWIDELGTGNRKFFRATAQDVAERDRSRVWKEMGLKGVGEL